MSTLEERVKQVAHDAGAYNVRFTTKKIMSDGPPSADATFVLPEAESIVAFLVPLDKDAIKNFLNKSDYDTYAGKMYDEYQLVGHIGNKVKEFLESEGHLAVAPSPNGVYRKGGSFMDQQYPPFSHRFAGYASGLGVPGWSGNLMTEEFGSHVYVGSVITNAKLTPDEPLDANYCEDCKLCVQSCPSNYFEKKEKITFTLGGREYSYAKRNAMLRCTIGCGGFTGLSRNGKWSTWSTGQYKVPDNDAELPKFFGKIMQERMAAQHEGKKVSGFADVKWAGNAGKLGVLARPKESTTPTCGDCQLVCGSNDEERKELMKALRTSGVVIPDENGNPKVVSAEEAEQFRKDAGFE